MNTDQNGHVENIRYISPEVRPNKDSGYKENRDYSPRRKVFFLKVCKIILIF